MIPASLPGSSGADDPFLVPRPAVVSFSGGRSSACMLARIVAAPELFDPSLTGEQADIQPLDCHCTD